MNRLTLTALALVGTIVASPTLAADTMAPTGAMPPSNSMAAPSGAGMMAGHASAPHKVHKAGATKAGMASTHSMAAPADSMTPANSMGGAH